jgi:hypothetical protein
MIIFLLQKYAILLILPNNWRFYFKIRQKETEAADFRFPILIFGEQVNDLTP